LVNCTLKALFSLILIILIIFPTSLFGITVAQMGGDTKLCDSCGMTVDSTGQNRYQIFDAAGHRYYACCPVCAFKLIKTYGDLNITSFCDYNGPSFPITIVAKNHGSIITVNPPTATVIIGGSCSKNRLVYNSQAADALIAAPNNGTSQWLSPLSNVQVAVNATRLNIAKAVLQYGGGESVACESCGMVVDVNNQARCAIFDANGTQHVACCPVCALKLLKTYGALNYTAICDYNGPSKLISINAKNYGADVTVSPSTALVIVGGSCTKNRFVFDSASADALLAPSNNGTSQWIYGMYNATVASNATRLDIATAALQYGGGPAATPTPTSAPTNAPSNPTSTPTITASPTTSPTTKPILNLSTPQPQLPDKECEACGMTVTADDQWHFKVTDGQGNRIYVECFMCALNEIKRQDTLHIETFCDCYGPDYKITIDSTGKGAQVIVNPSTAIYLYTGSCENNRVAYNQTAADFLTSNYSQYTSKLQQHEWQMQPTVISVSEGVNLYNEMGIQEADKSFIAILLIAVIAVVAVIIGVFAYTRLKKKPPS
jgi:hypothetical protein